MRLGSKLRFWVVEMTCLFIRLCVRKLFILYLRCWDLYVVTTISWQNRSTSYNQSHIFLLQWKNLVFSVMGFLRLTTRRFHGLHDTRTRRSLLYNCYVQRRVLSDYCDGNSVKDSFVPVLIVGAGPVGLALSILLTKLGRFSDHCPVYIKKKFTVQWATPVEVLNELWNCSTPFSILKFKKLCSTWVIKMRSHFNISPLWMQKLNPR